MKNFKFPAQTGIYKVIPKKTFNLYEYNTCRLQISVGHGDKHEGEKFAASLNWAKDRFEKVVVCVNDTLQRYNLLNKGMNEKTAYAMAYEAGNKWIKENIKAQDSKIEIIRWDYWLKQEDFKNHFKLINKFYSKNSFFKQSIDSTVFDFLSKNDIFKDEYKKNNSIEYLLEELAVYPLMAKKHKAADIYPGTVFPQFKLICEGKVEGITGIENVVFTRIDFLKNTKTPK